MDYIDECPLLTEVDRMDEDDLSYEFNTLIVWQSKASGHLYYASDAG